MQFIFGRYHRNTISATVDTMIPLLLELVSLRDGHLILDSGCQLTRSELQSITGVTVVLKFLKFQNCPEIVLELQIVLKF